MWFFKQYLQQNNQFKKGDNMKISDVATVRTGMLSIRKKAILNERYVKKYKMLNLKCINDNGYIDTFYCETFLSKELLKPEYFTRMDDILIRLSSPYTAVIVNDPSQCDLLIPSHFAILRISSSKVTPEYILWILNREKTQKLFNQNSSGSTVLGTISAGLISSVDVKDIPIEKQVLIGQLQLLSNKEQELIIKLASEKEKYNKEIINRIYKSTKRGN